MLSKLFGNKAFYKRVLHISIPIILQQGITNFVNLLDNIMVGQLNENAIAGVAIANQIMFVVNIVIMGVISGAGLFLVQYMGAQNKEGVKQAFRTKVILGIGIVFIFELCFFFFKEPLAAMFLTEAASIQAAVTYLTVMMWALPLIGVTFLYAFSFREVGLTKIPMITGLAAVVVNGLLNYALIFGNFGAPALGVKGAAIATVIARAVECLILIAVAHKKGVVFAQGVFKDFRIAPSLFKRILKKSLPLILNDFFWSVGTTAIVLAYSQLGENVVSALTISQTANNMFFILFGALANSIGIIIGGELGANNLEQAWQDSTKLITLGVLVAMGCGVIMVIISRWIPLLYNVSAETRSIASHLMLISGLFFVTYTYSSCCFFTLRAGGAVMQTLILDSLFMWGCQVIVAFSLIYFTKLDIYVIYTLVQITDFLKMGVATYLWRKGKWVNNLALKIE